MKGHILPPSCRPFVSPRTGIGIAALCWLAFGVIGWLVIIGDTATFDRAGIMLWRAGPALDPIGPAKLSAYFRDVTGLGGVVLRSFAAVLAVVALIFMRRRWLAFVYLVSILLGWAMNTGIKNIVDRARPDIVPRLMAESSASFPSGHSFNSAVVYIGMALAFAACSPQLLIRLAVMTIAIFISLLIAFSRVWLGVHWPSDVIAGWLGGTGWTFATAALVGIYSERQLSASRGTGTFT